MACRCLFLDGANELVIECNLHNGDPESDLEKKCQWFRSVDLASEYKPGPYCTMYQP